MSAHGRPEVLVSVPASPGFAHVLRTVAAAFGARMDLSIDDLDDLRIAVDEAFAYLLDLGGATTAVALRLAPAGTAVEAILSAVDGPTDAWPPPSHATSLAWQVLTGLSDEVDLLLDEGRPAIRIAKGARRERPT